MRNCVLWSELAVCVLRTKTIGTLFNCLRQSLSRTNIYNLAFPLVFLSILTGIFEGKIDVCSEYHNHSLFVL